MSEKSAKIVGSKPGPRRRAADAGVAEAVVEAALLAIGEDRVGLGRFLELLFGLVVAGIAIGVVLQRELAVRALDLLIGRLALDAEDLVVVTLAHAGPHAPFRHLHHRRPQQPVAEHVAAPELFDDFAVALPVGRLVGDRLVEVRIEVGAERLDRPDAALAQRSRAAAGESARRRGGTRRRPRCRRPPCSARSRSSTSGSSSSMQVGRRRFGELPGARARCACGSCRTRRSCAAADRSSRRAAAAARRATRRRRRRGAVAPAAVRRVSSAIDIGFGRLSSIVSVGAARCQVSVGVDHPADRLRQALDGVDRARVAHPRRPDDADRAGAVAVGIGRRRRG